MKSMIVLLAVIATLKINVAFAFDPSIHKEISLQSFNVLKQCEHKLNSHFPELKTKHFFAAANEISDGTSKEDTTQLKTRAKNWHFYNTYGNLKQGPFFFESMDHIFALRNEQIQTNPSRNEALGRVLHYIQDVHVPAHVVPVFHGAPTGNDHDAFDDYLLSDKDKEEVISSISCDSLISEAYALRALNLNRLELNRLILDDAAKKTLLKIHSPIGNLPINWSYFWREPAEKETGKKDTQSLRVAFGKQAKRFGSYVGIFGQPTEIKITDNKKIMVESKHFKKFYIGQYRDVVKKSAIFILMNYQ